MAEAYWLGMAALAALLGMGWLALSLDIHWRQAVTAEGPKSVTGQTWSLRLSGAVSLAAALLFCLVADHASMAVLVWFMLIAASAVAVTMLLTWRPHSLRLLATLDNTQMTSGTLIQAAKLLVLAKIGTDKFDLAAHSFLSVGRFKNINLSPWH